MNVDPVSTQSSLEEAFSAKALSAGIPFILVRMDIINRCNLKCVMCASWQVGGGVLKEYAPQDIAEMLQGIGPLVSETMLSCGFEPLLSSHFEGIVSFISKQYPHINISFCSNGTMMTEPVRRAIIENNVKRVNFSIDGATKETYENIRRGAMYEKVIGNILALSELKAKAGSIYPQIILNYTFMDSNVQEIPEFVALAKHLGANKISLRASRTIKGGDPRNPKHISGDGGAAFDIWKDKVVEQARRHEIEINYNDINSSNKTLHSPPNNTGLVGSENERTGVLLRGCNWYCGQPFRELFVRENGMVTPCCFIRPTLEKVGAGGLKDVYFGKVYKSLRDSILQERIHPLCEDCPVVRQWQSTRKAATISAPIMKVECQRDDRIIKAQRVGFTEGALLFANYLKRIIGQENPLIVRVEKAYINWLYSTSGFYDRSIRGSYFDIDYEAVVHSVVYKEWLVLYEKSLLNAEGFGFFLESHMFHEHIKHLPEYIQSLGVKEQGTDFDMYWREPRKIWPLLRNKKVLLVSSFAELMRQQYSTGSLGKVYSGFPDCQFSIFRFPYTFFNSGPDQNAHETRVRMADQILGMDFDVALLACGSYGGILTDIIHRSGRTAIYMGSSLHNFFGISPERKGQPGWLSEIPDEYRPVGWEKIEKGRYWVGRAAKEVSSKSV